MAEYSRYSEASPIGSQWLQENVPSRTAWAHAFPRPRHTRIMKPRSAGNSPSSSSGRRRTTVAESVMHGPPNQYQASLAAALLASADRNERPISWHPSSARGRGLSNPSCLSGFVADDYTNMGTLSCQSANALPVYGSNTMLPYATSAGPSYSPGYYSVYSGMQDAMPLPQQTPMSMCGSQGEPINWDIAASNADLSTMTQTTSDGWSLDMLSMANIPPAETTCPSYASVPSPGELSGPSTPDFLPIQQFDDDPNPQQKKEGKAEEELVGMGLYNQPDGSLGQRYQGTLGKGLKLEETFSPDVDQDDASADVNEAGNNVVPVQQQSGHHDYASMTQQPTFSLPKQPCKQALNLIHKSFFFDNDDLDQQAMTAAQPFANFNQSCMSYGYAWI